mmetsp:Transcript_23983/g.35199  ORF Transcript_23983/g.35199 Transcript_23983/m.35199 type:complete len:267 (-) Transcript_23983:226-1026(-)|eukprot:CAMPEP_0185021016 /NCGR_PEP_ID=MMETSP1103-20130426/3675_1 /TAXON_ID=36769 /ORGANISM="Paraphysomonas bandaiensis, Strain Caron Lab Isolate" /LENGTH=266 /DNA_ID=CAMNT_0027552287 /DNA_START=84 /DNA_END=884 /DNA_ORIENTATION=+
MLNRAYVSAAVCGMGVAMGKWDGMSSCSDDHIPARSYGFPFEGNLSSYDAMSIRRGFQVYRQICASCHSINKISFRQLVGVTHTEKQMKAIAESYDIVDGPDETGEMFERPGKLSDTIPGPYRNEEEGRAANNGSLPPDLSLMVKARHDGVNYIYALLTGYVDPPAGKNLLPGLHYNPYFTGGAISMAKQLEDGQVEYEDGTIASEAQMAKDVASFLAWTAEPEHDQRKFAGMKMMFGLMVAIGLTAFYKRFRWSVVKTRKISYVK